MSQNVPAIPFVMSQHIQRIAVFRALQLGDMLVAVPALRAIRRRFPHAEITLIGLPWAQALVERYPRYLDRFVAFPGWPGIGEVEYDSARTDTFLRQQRRYGYDLVVQMHGSGGASNPFALALGAPLTAGYYEGEPPAGLGAAAEYPAHEPEVLRNLGLAKLLGCDALSLALEFPLTVADRAEAETLLGREWSGGSPLIGLHPGARPPARRWPAGHFAALADALVRRFDARLVLTGGPGEEATAIAVAEQMHAKPLILAGRTSLGGLAAVIAQLDLFVGNDTGPAHLACAVETPSVTIFGPADPRRWAPLDTAHHTIVRHPVSCSPCSYWDCPIDHRCLRRLAPSTVLDTATELLRTGALACNA